jgi:hypothetical protein
MLTEQKLKIAWKAYLAELAAIQRAEHPSEAWLRSVCDSISAIGSPKRPEFSLRDSSRLAEVLIEMLEIATGQAEIVGWRPVTLGEGRKVERAGP